jgi:hypothetical protein
MRTDRESDAGDARTRRTGTAYSQSYRKTVQAFALISHEVLFTRESFRSWSAMRLRIAVTGCIQSRTKRSTLSHPGPEKKSQIRITR